MVNTDNTEPLATMRILKFLDKGSFNELCALSECGVVAGYGSVDGRLVYVYSQYGEVNRSHSDKIGLVYSLAVKMGAPVIAILDSKGMEIANGLEIMDAYGKIFTHMSECSGVVPQISVILGDCAGTAAFIPSLSDFVIMAEKASNGNPIYMLNSPATIKSGVYLSAEAACGSKAQAEAGLVHLSVPTEDSALLLVKQLLDYLPSNNLDEAPLGIFAESFENGLTINDENSPNSQTINIIRSFADNNTFFETAAAYAFEIITGFVRLNGYTVGVIASNANLLTPDAAEKASSFSVFCDAFNIPILTLTAASGYKYSVSEQKNILKNNAKLLYSLASATVPRVNLITGECVGSPYLIMNSKHIGTDLTYAWNIASLSVIGKQAAEKVLNMSVSDGISEAAKNGYIDKIIEPSETRRTLIQAFEMLNSKRVLRHAKKRGSAFI